MTFGGGACGGGVSAVVVGCGSGGDDVAVVSVVIGVFVDVVVVVVVVVVGLFCSLCFSPECSRFIFPRFGNGSVMFVAPTLSAGSHCSGPLPSH